MITAKELELCKAQAQFQKMCEFLRQAADEGQRLDQVERACSRRRWRCACGCCRRLSKPTAMATKARNSNTRAGPLRRLEQPHDKRYLSIFGELLISRYVYGTREGQLMNGCRWTPPWAFRRATILTCWKTGCNVCA